MKKGKISLKVTTGVRSGLQQQMEMVSLGAAAPSGVGHMDQLLQMLTNLSKSQHQTAMAVIGNLR